jgi:hypothetical protein
MKALILREWISPLMEAWRRSNAKRPPFPDESSHYGSLIGLEAQTNANIIGLTLFSLRMRLLKS